MSSGDLLDMRTNNITHAYIDGRAFSPENKQAYLNRKFRSKYAPPSVGVK